MNSVAYSPNPPGQSLISRIHELLGTPPAIPLSSEPPVTDAASLDDLAARAEQAGLQPTRFRAPTDAVLGALEKQRPLLTMDAEGKPLLLLSRLGSRARVEDESGRQQWVDRHRLAEHLGLAHSGVEHDWVLVESSQSRDLEIESQRSPWRNALTLIASEKPNLGAIVIYAVGVGLLSLALPLAVQALVNTVAFGQLLQPIVVLTLLLGAGLVFAAALRALQAWMVEIVQRRVFVRLVSELGERLPRMHVGAFESGQGPELVNRFFDVFTAQKAVASLLLGGTEALLTALVGLLVLSFYHPVLLGFGLVLLVGTLLVFVVFGFGASRTTIAESKAKFAVAGWLEEMARHLFALKMSGGGEHARRRLDRLASDWLHHRAAHFRVFFRQYLGALGLQVIAHASLLGIGGWLVVERELTIGQLVAAELIVTAVVGSLSKLGGKLESVYDLVAAADKLGVLLAFPIEPEGGDEPVCGEHAASIELRDVSSEGGELDSLDLHIAPGQTIALHGDRRASTALVDLLFGLRLPRQGSILIDGQDLRDVKLAALRSRIGVVREPEILPGTVADNVRAVSRQVSSSEIWELLAKVGLSEEIRRLPRGLQTPLMPSGAPLDRIGALRLTLARALAAHPAVLILDGVIDALPERERSRILDEARSDRTLIVLTHERAVVGACDRCLELEDEELQPWRAS